MIWIVGSDIIGSEQEKQARLQYIKEVSGERSVSWKRITFSYMFDFFYCTTRDGINGTFITAHKDIVALLCTCQDIANRDFVIANTCIWVADFDKRVFQQMLKHNSRAQLFYAKQALELIDGVMPRYTNVIDDIGAFGFMTSKSERILYRNRKKGFMEAVKRAFDFVVLEENLYE